MRCLFLALLIATGSGLADVTAPTRAPESPALSPEESLARLRLPAGYEARLVAAEPLVLDPVAFDWDARGRLWVVEMADYPLGLDNEGARGGRIRVLEDRDADGTYDHSTLFAEGLNFPNGILTWRKGVIVTAAPDILYLEDSDEDGQADRQEVLYTGLTEGNQQLRANGLRWGLDNWIYVAAGGHHGRHGADTKLRSSRTGKEVLVGSRDFRIRPDTGEVEPQSGPTQFGRERDDWGHWFGTQNSHPLWHYVLPDHYLRRNPHLATGDARVQLPGGSNPPVYPAKAPEKRYHSFQQSGRYTSACAGMIYRDEVLFPPDSTIAFICEPFHNLVQALRLEEDGVTFKATRLGAEGEPDFFASSDRWCRPVMTRTGPDGALWVADMYRYMIEHPQFLPPEGKAELLPHYRLGDDLGRIYRIVKKDAHLRPMPTLAGRSAEELAEQLQSPNGWVRDKAQQLLLQGGASGSVAAVASQRLAPQPQTRLQALCTLDGLNALTSEHLLAALQDPHPRVRENALRLAESTLSPIVLTAVHNYTVPADSNLVVESTSDPAVLTAACALVNDPDPKVRLQLAFSLGEWKTAAAGQALATLLSSANDNDFLLTACLSSALPHLDQVARDASPEVALRLLPTALGGGNREALALLLQPHLASEKRFERASLLVIATFLAELQERGLTLEKLDNQQADALSKLLATFPEYASALSWSVSKETQPAQARLAILAVLARHQPTRENAIQRLQSELQAATDPDHWRLAVAGLAATSDDRLPSLLLAQWQTLTPSQRDHALGVLLGRARWASELLQALESAHLKPAEISPTHRLALSKHSDKTLQARAAKLFNSAATSNRAAVVEKHRPALKLPADKKRGHAVYQRACAACHQHGNEGLAIGPHLSSVAAHEPEKILANILDPNLDIQPGYHAYIATLQDGQQLFGLLAGESGASLTFKLPDASIRTLRRSEIKEIKSTGVSLMPDGLEATLSDQDLADLIAFLRAP